MSDTGSQRDHRRRPDDATASTTRTSSSPRTPSTDDDLEDMLDRGYSPNDRPRGSTAHGTTACEESHRRDHRRSGSSRRCPTRTRPTARPTTRAAWTTTAVGGDDPDAIAAEDDWLGDNEVGDARAGRLVARRRGRARGRREAGLGQRRGRRRRRAPRPRRRRCTSSTRSPTSPPGPTPTGTTRPDRGDRIPDRERDPMNELDSLAPTDEWHTDPLPRDGAAPPQGAPAPALHRVDAASSTLADLAGEHGIRLPDALADDWPPRAARPPTSAAGSASSGSTTPPGRACAARPTCAASCARRPRTTPPRARAGSSSRSTRRRTPRSSAASPRPSRSCSTRPAGRLGARPGSGSASSSRRAGSRHPLDARTLARLAARYAGDGAGQRRRLRAVERRAARASSPTSRRPSPSPGAPASRSCPTAASCSAPQSVVETLEHLEPDRIGHGVRGVEDPAVLDARRRGRRDPRGLPRQQRRPRGLRRRRRRAAAAHRRRRASPSRSGPTTRCCSAPGSPRSTPRPATLGFDDAELAALARGSLEGSRAPRARAQGARSPTSTPGSPRAARDGERPPRPGRTRTGPGGSPAVGGRRGRPICSGSVRPVMLEREMKTSAACPRTPIDRLLRPSATPRRGRLVAPVVALAACSGGSPRPADATASAAGQPARPARRRTASPRRPRRDRAERADHDADPDRAVTTSDHGDASRTRTSGTPSRSTRIARTLPWPAGQRVGPGVRDRRRLGDAATPAHATRRHRSASMTSPHAGSQ